LTQGSGAGDDRRYAETAARCVPAADQDDHRAADHGDHRDGHCGHGRFALGRIGAKALVWFVSSSLVSLLLGMVLVNLFQPGAGLALSPATGVGDLATSQLTFRHFIIEIFPTSALDAMAQNNVLQLLVFSVFAGVGLSAIGEKGASSSISPMRWSI
jgi:L-cystine uptake protein TcyP (sodium:dicarboxylate symporter family)